MKEKLPENESEFLNLMEEIDKKLTEQSVLIHQRPLHAIREVCMRFKIELEVAPQGTAVPGVYRGNSLSLHVENWYKSKYGDRLEVIFSPGYAAILIKGNPYKIKFPLILGRVKLVFDPNIEKYNNLNITLPKLNALLCIEGFTSNFARSLSRKEMFKIANFFASVLSTLQGLAEIKSISFIPEARADLDPAVSHIFSQPPHYGQSKWSSLQFTEKLIKSYLKLKGEKIPRKRHDLITLSALAEKNGLAPIPRDLLKRIQCPAGVRYGEVPVTLKEAIDAHHASLSICKGVIPQIKSALK